MKTGSLFSGYGGLDMAVNQVFDSETAWFVEYDKAPSKILAHHWPDVPNYGDITTVDWSAVEPVDILTGGSPCRSPSPTASPAHDRPATLRHRPGTRHRNLLRRAGCARRVVAGWALRILRRPCAGSGAAHVG